MGRRLRATGRLAVADEGDNDPARCLPSLVAALQTIAANIGADVLKALQSPQSPPTESILTSLLNEITTILDDFVLVLDDYHVIDAKTANVSTSVDNALTFLLAHLPLQMHLVITTREDPQLPLAQDITNALNFALEQLMV